MQQRQTTISLWCDRLLEGGWLLALVFIPSYFNLLSARHFEPDKATSLRAIVTVMVAVALVGLLERLLSGGARSPATAEGGGGNLWQRFRAIPLALPAVIYALVFLLATALSLTPHASLWGSYQRLQGTYTHLSYITLAALIVLHLRRREQFDRLITVAVLGSLPAVGYGLIQHLQIDPLPWRGDVVSRVASTMGNSIFVAAYLIMIVPLAFYKAISSFSAPRSDQPVEGGRQSDWGWAAAYLLAVLAGLMILLAAVMFGAVVRVSDLRYWWVLPGSLFVACGLFILPTLRLHTAEKIGPATLIPGILTLLYVMVLGIAYTLGGADQRVQAAPGRGGTEWPLWLVGGAVLTVGAYALLYLLPRRNATSLLLQRLNGVAMLVVSFLVLLAIFFTQSRGPWIGLLVGLFVFFTLLLIQAMRNARREGSPRATLWRNLLIGEVVLAVALAGFIVVFNYSDAPVFQQLRQVPYIGRMGRLLDVSAGTTGDVRMKIWFGDDRSGGAVALITSEPFRTIFGWGPESMFVAYNKYYPPSLANVESRGASPDRSHQAYLDELVTKGVVGLISYLFVILSFFVLAWRLLRSSDSWPMQVFFIACISAVVAHSVEGLTGIPIVATLMMLWVVMAATVVAGALGGHYTIGRVAPPAQPEPVETPVEEPAAPKQAGQRATAGRRRQQGAARGAMARPTGGRRSAQSNPARLLIYTIVLFFGLMGAWFMNVDNVYADMRFQQSQIYTDNPQSNLEQQLVGMGYLLDAIRMEPQQDFYYLNLGRTLMSIADIRRQMQDTPLGQPSQDALVDDLLALPDARSAQQFVMSKSLLELMSYTNSVLERAYSISPYNKDNSANLARMHSFWYLRFNQDPEQLRQSINWYQRGHEVAPQDVVIMNEYAGAIAMLGTYTSSQQDTTAANGYFDQAEQLLRQAKQLDPRYTDTDLRLADLLRVRGRYAEAVDLYLALLDRNPNALNGQIGAVGNALKSQPDQLKRLRDRYQALATQNPNDATIQGIYGQLAYDAKDLDAARTAYARQVQLQPQSIDARRNYTLVLSDSAKYQEAITEAQAMLELVKQQQDEEQQNQVQNLINYLQFRAQGG
ncbi:MAG: O-antigen ligase family protein [Roseiflexaceae bacterium]